MQRKFPEPVEKTDKTKLKQFYYENFPSIYNRDLIEELDVSKSRKRNTTDRYRTLGAQANMNSLPNTAPGSVEVTVRDSTQCPETTTVAQQFVKPHLNLKSLVDTPKDLRSRSSAQGRGFFNTMQSWQPGMQGHDQLPNQRITPGGQYQQNVRHSMALPNSGRGVPLPLTAQAQSLGGGTQNTPSNVELRTLFQGSGNQFQQRATLSQFAQKNIGDLKQFKVNKLEGAKQTVDYIHGSLKKKRGIKQEIVNLDKLHTHLSQKLQDMFQNLPFHSGALDNLTHLNKSFVPVLDYLVCYKPELGLLLQRLIESYNLVFLEQFQGYYQNENAREQNNDANEKLLNKQEEAIRKAKNELYTQQDMVRMVIESKDREISELQDRVNDAVAFSHRLQQQIEEARFNNGNCQVGDPIRSKKRAENQAAVNSVECSEDSDCGPGEYENRLIKSQFIDCLDDFKWMKAQRHANLSNLQDVVSRLIKKGCEHRGTQTNDEDDDLHLPLMNIKSNPMMSVPASKQNLTSPKSKTNNPSHAEVTSFNQSPERLGEQPGPAILSGIGSSRNFKPNELLQIAGSWHKPAITQSGAVDPVVMEDLKMKVDKMITFVPGATQDAKRKFKDLKPHDTGEGEKKVDILGDQQFELTPMLVLFLENTIKSKEMNFDDYQQPDLHKSSSHDLQKESPSKQEEQDEGEKSNKSSKQQPQPTKSTQLNGLQQLNSSEPKLISWLLFRHQILEILDDRLYHASEIGGAVNNAHLAFDEHLLVYFIQRYKTRTSAERKLAEFLLNLKYYTMESQWRRAVLYSALLGCLKGPWKSGIVWELLPQPLDIQKSKTDHNASRVTNKSSKQEDQTEGGNDTDQKTVSKSKTSGNPKWFQRKDTQSVSPHEHSDIEMPPRQEEFQGNDIFFQEFFLHGYSLIAKERKNFIEAKDGYTYMPWAIQERTTVRVATFADKGLQGQFDRRILKAQRKVQDNKQDDFESEYIDVDHLIYEYLELYKEERRDRHAKMLHRFRKRMATCQSSNYEMNADLIEGLGKERFNKQQQTLPMMSFAAKATFARATLHTLMSFGNANNLEITEEQFMAASSHYGLHNPTPVICKRLANYGIPEEIKKALDSALQEKKADLQAVGLTKDIVHSYTCNVPDPSYNPPKGDQFVKNIPEREMNPDSSDDEELEKDMKQALPPTTKAPQENKRLAATQDLKMLCAQKRKNDFLTPPSEILIKNVKLRVKDILNEDPDHVRAQSQIKFIGSNKNVSITRDQHIVVPSFGLTSELLASHFSTLKQLQRRIYLLKQSYLNLGDSNKSWQQIDEILRVLERGVDYLGTEKKGEDDEDKEAIEKKIAEMNMDQVEDQIKENEKVYIDENLEKDEKQYEDDLNMKSQLL